MSTTNNMLREVEDTEKMTEEQQKEHYVINYLKPELNYFIVIIIHVRGLQPLMFDR